MTKYKALERLTDSGKKMFKEYYHDLFEELAEDDFAGAQELVKDFLSELRG